MEWLALIVGGLATYRLSLLVSKEDGPALIFRKLRRLPPPKSATKKGLSCLFCVSISASALICWVEWYIGWLPGNALFLYWLAMSSLAILINQQWTKGDL